jgi:hypothetical protein
MPDAAQATQRYHRSHDVVGPLREGRYQRLGVGRERGDDIGWHVWWKDARFRVSKDCEGEQNDSKGQNSFHGLIHAESTAAVNDEFAWPRNPAKSMVFFILNAKLTGFPPDEQKRGGIAVLDSRLACQPCSPVSTHGKVAPLSF